MSSQTPRAAPRNLAIAVALVTAACAKPPSAEHAAAGPEDPTEETAPKTADATTADDTTADDTTADGTTADDTTAESEAPKGPPLSSLCKSMCGAQSSKCKPDQVKECQRNYCDRYGKAAKVCEPSVRAALECAKAQPDFLLCAAVVPDSCAKKFKATEDCLATGVAPVAAEDGTKLPAGWAKYEARDAHFTVAMPKGVAVTNEGDVRIWSSEGGGVKYEVRRGPRPEEKKFDQRAFLRIATKLLGKCAPRMKLYSLVEADDRTIIQFKTGCPDKTQHRGSFYVHGKDYFVIQATWSDAPNAEADTDTFTYSFEHR
jgi:hypothetical protein